MEFVLNCSGRVNAFSKGFGLPQTIVILIRKLKLC